MSTWQYNGVCGCVGGDDDNDDVDDDNRDDDDIADYGIDDDDTVEDDHDHDDDVDDDDNDDDNDDDDDDDDYSLVYTSGADSRTRVYTSVDDCRSASGWLSSAVADCSFQSSKMLNLKCSRRPFPSNQQTTSSIYLAMAHADLKKTCY